jgi:4a-hydroxytetrahydrobiopterin dehydratase
MNTDTTQHDVPLEQAHCLRKRTPEHRLAPEAVAALLGQVEGWQVVEDGTVLEKTFTFKDYYRTMSFVNAVAHMANGQIHHPDMGVHYNRCVVRFSTHDAGGLTANDFICAARANALFA